MITSHIDITAEWAQQHRQHDHRERNHKIAGLLAELEEARQARQQQTVLGVVTVGALAVGGYYLGKKLGGALGGSKD